MKEPTGVVTLPKKGVAVPPIADPIEDLTGNSERSPVLGELVKCKYEVVVVKTCVADKYEGMVDRSLRAGEDIPHVSTTKD